ncbi:MAG: threonine/serine dehydratase [Planctomycetota bacterium]
MDVIDPDDVRQAAQRISLHVLRTPCVPSEVLSRQLGCQVHFKAESLQYGGAFKARGATNAVFALNEDQAARGVVTHSSGNHAAALARAASLRGVPAHVVMPENSTPSKIRAVQSYGVEPIFCDPTTEARAEAAESLRQSTGGILVHPYDTPTVMAGQGTVGLEITEQMPDLDTIFVPVGGGGLLSGVLTIVKATDKRIQVIAVEPEWADDTARSLATGVRQVPHRYDSVADGLRTAVGENTFPIIRALVDDLILVSERQILTAMRTIAESAKLVAEPSGAVAFAGLCDRVNDFQGKSVAVIISGGNLNFGRCQLGTAGT